ncbi:protein adenylyltransferase SelO [Variovorax sp. HJSM1_2]|uniref:protein adenylyltransferase SelO n=1 Tax=Variovorax sp. HJSM1_2 TaxID=3366263 RepID=UPI003BBB881F
MTVTPASFPFDNTFARSLDGFFVPWLPERVPAPAMVKLNHALATELGLDAGALDSPEGAAIFAGNQVPEGATPLAQAYAGHQFGGFSPQLGDGRALLLGELIDVFGQRRDLALKGSGRTPFSRGGDGKAALGPVLREYLMGEAMHALGIPTTRVLAAVTTGEQANREGLPPGAVLARVAASHIRVGTFQYFAARGDTDKLRQLADYTIARHDPAAAQADNPYLALLVGTSQRQAALIAQWMAVGFIHGVMNTDNMTLSGETIDYGPCAFMNQYDPSTVFSSIDHHGRYAYGNQPPIAQWNLARLAEALLPLVDADRDKAVAAVTKVLHSFPVLYEQRWLALMRQKLGLEAAQEDDLTLVNDFLALLQAQGVDFSQAFRGLGEDVDSRAHARNLFIDLAAFDAWTSRWHRRLAKEVATPGSRAGAMQQVNPVYIPRNHKVEEALAAAVERRDFAPFEQLLTVLSQPFSTRVEWAEYAQPATPAQALGYQTFCGT